MRLKKHAKMSVWNHRSLYICGILVSGAKWRAGRAHGEEAIYPHTKRRALSTPALFFYLVRMKKKHTSEWDRANHYLQWAQRQGLSKSTQLALPQLPELKLTAEERKMLRAKIRSQKNQKP
jgi:hypothetical protein